MANAENRDRKADSGVEAFLAPVWTGSQQFYMHIAVFHDDSKGQGPTKMRFTL